MTRSKTQKLFDVSDKNIVTYGTQPVKHICLKYWRKFKNSFSYIDLNEITYTVATNLMKSNIFDQS